MVRKIVLALAVAAGCSLFGGYAASASTLNSHNPYASFNSGVNYGAQRWEHQHQGCRHGRYHHAGSRYR